MFLCTWEYNSLGDPTRSLKKKHVLKYQLIRKHSYPPPSDQLICKFFEGIWNNYVDIQQKNMQVRFIIILHVWWYNSLSHATLHYEGWSTNVSKCKSIQIGQPDQLFQVKSFITVFLSQFGNILSTILHWVRYLSQL